MVREDGARKGEPSRLDHAGARVGAMQLDWICPLSDEKYVTERGWESATLASCPFHAEGGCGVGRLGTYARVAPPGTRVPRWWCPKKRASISLLPSFLAARFSGTLAAVEAVATAVEAAGGISAAVDQVRPPDVINPVALPGALRWIRRRVVAVRAALLAIATLLPARFEGVTPTLSSFRRALGTDQVLVTLRETLGWQLATLTVPLGFRARVTG